MNIIIAGAGQVGFNLARTLSIGHNVTVIDKNEDALHRIQESLDILPLKGDVESAECYDTFKNTKIDLFIAVTNIDNVNLISTMMATSVLSIEKTFVRLQRYFKDVFRIKERLGIDEIIFPTRLASKNVSSLLHYPYANNVKFFKYTKHLLISLRISNEFTSKKIIPDKFIVAGIERDKEFFLPNDNDLTIMANDLVYLFGLEDDIKAFYLNLEKNNTIKPIQNCVVYGGDELGIAIAKSFLEIGRNVKLIEKDFDLCEEADTQLMGEATVINAKYSAHELFEEENLHNADLFVATSRNDEFNIIKCLEAKERNIPKIIALNNDMEYYNLMHSLGIITTRGPKINTYSKIIEEINSHGVVVQKSFCGLKATILLKKIFIEKKYVKPINLKEIKLFYIRDEQLFVFKEKTTLLKDDIVFGITTAKLLFKLNKWIYEL
jgi:trk system potassium uptake protein TrkA